MRKERVNPKNKPQFYDVENISVTAVYNDDFYRDVYTKNNYRQYLKGYIDYNYSPKPWVIKPFAKVGGTQPSATKYLRWLREFNLNPIPTRLSFRTEVDRNYNELEFRNIDALLSGNAATDFDVLKNRNFYFGWQYALGFNFSKSLKAEVNSVMRTLNDQLDVNSMNNNSIFNDVFRAGRPVLYNHKVQLNYRLPFEYIPYMDFINSEIGYGLTYNWNSRSTALLSSPEGNLGTIGQNTNTIMATGTVDFPKFLGKFNYFKKISTKLQKRKQEIDSLNNAYTKDWEKKKFVYKPYKFKNKLSPIQSFASIFMAVKQIDFNYNENNGTVLPGLLSAPNWYGYGQTAGGPSYGFLLGSQSDIRRLAIENGWITGSTLMSDPYSQMNNKNFTASMQVVPMNDLRIDFNVLHNYNRTFTQSGFNVDANPSTPGFDFSYGNDSFTYSNTSFTAKTAFKDGKEIYAQMIENARKISQQMGGTLGTNGFTQGHGLGNAYVLIPAFRAAMEGTTPDGPITNAKSIGIPLPNWKITYSGLRNMPIINGQFTKFDLNHSYTSTYTASGIMSNIDYYNNPSAMDVNGNYINPFVYSQVGYVEAFAPLIGVDFTMRNNIQFRAQYNKDRMWMLGLVNNTLTEDSGKEYVIGFGYIIKDFQIGMNYGKNKKNYKSDLNIRGDFRMRDNLTNISNILLNDSQVTGGQRLFSIKLSADYNVSQNLNIRLFYDQMMTKYKVSTAFPLSTVRAGISATFTFDGK